jgi:hypothetical protein
LLSFSRSASIQIFKIVASPLALLSHAALHTACCVKRMCQAVVAQLQQWTMEYRGIVKACAAGGEVAVHWVPNDA